MRKQSPSQNQLTTWVARSCSAAIVALPLFMVSTLSGQTTDEADIVASHLTEVVQSTNGTEALRATQASLDGTADAARWTKTRHSGEFCVLCEDRQSLGGVWWHRVPYESWFGWSFGHGLHDWLLWGTCALHHPGLCLIWWPSSEQTLTARELARGSLRCGGRPGRRDSRRLCEGAVGEHVHRALGDSDSGL